MPNIFDPKNLERLVAASNPPQQVQSVDPTKHPDYWQGPPDEWQGPHKKPDVAGKWATALAVLGPLADGISTKWAMDQSGPNMKIAEGNPIFGKNASGNKILGIKAGQAALQGLLTHLAREIAPNSARVAGVSSALIGGIPAAMNVRNGLKAREANKGVKE